MVVQKVLRWVDWRVDSLVVLMVDSLVVPKVDHLVDHLAEY